MNDHAPVEQEAAEPANEDGVGETTAAADNTQETMADPLPA